MSMWYLKLLFFFAIALTYGTPLAQEEENPWEKAERTQAIISEEFKKCDATNAVVISFDELFDPRVEPFQANPKFLHKCIRVKGVAGWRHLYKDSLSQYRTQQSGIVQAHTLVRQHVGLANHELMTEKKLLESHVEGEVIGILGTCGFTMGGYCHYYQGPYIIAVSINGERLTEVTRFIGKAAQKELGNLKEISFERARRYSISPAFEDWIEALSKGDKPAFEWILETAGINVVNLNLNFEDLARGELDNPYFEGVREAFFDEKSVYRKLVDHQKFERKYFQRFTNVTLPPDMETPWYGRNRDGFVACICITDNCDGRWPISSADFYIGENTPYICKQLFERENELKNSSYNDHVETDENEVPFWKIYRPKPSAKTKVVEKTWPPKND